jgi:predicted alpha/beta hydrolase family esterase
MNLVGDEKRIQAQFRELVRENERLVPPFDTMWARAVAAEATARPRFARHRFVIAAIVVVVLAISLAWWGHARKVAPVRESVVAEPKTTPRTSNPPELATVESPQQQMKPRKVRRILLASRSRAAASISRKTFSLSSWQSPTAVLMEPSRSSILKSWPQLDQSARDMQSFLPGLKQKERIQ